MSAPEIVIETYRRVQTGSWVARVRSGGHSVAYAFDKTEDQAIELARKAIKGGGLGVPVKRIANPERVG